MDFRGGIFPLSFYTRVRPVRDAQPMRNVFKGYDDDNRLTNGHTVFLPDQEIIDPFFLPYFR